LKPSYGQACVHESDKWASSFAVFQAVFLLQWWDTPASLSLFIWWLSRSFVLTWFSIGFHN
jgi:hypothetical protein